MLWIRCERSERNIRYNDGVGNKYGGDRVFDTPTSENAMTEIGVGAAVVGLRPIMIHQRLDFFLLAMDQLVNSAAKWRFMFAAC